MARQGIDKALGDKRFLAVFRSESESGLKDLRWNSWLFPLFLAVLFFFVPGSWGACTSGSQSITNVYTIPCENSSCGTQCLISAAIGNSVGGVYFQNGSYWTDCVVKCIFSGNSCRTGNYCTSIGLNRGELNCNSRCGTQTEADSVACSLKGGDWIWNGSECVENTIDTTSCDIYRQQCAQLGGVFEGTPLQDGCSAICNTCGSTASKRILEVKSQSCCSQGLAPQIDKMCTTPLESGIGMTVSSNANLECSDPNLSDEGLQNYVENCSDPNSIESSESGPSSSGDESSSSGEVPGDSLGRDYYPILDTIRDSLLNIRKNVETITTCLLTPDACAGLSLDIPDSIKTPVFAFDTAFRKYLKPLMDSSLKLDSNQLKALMKLDTNLLKQMKNDSAALKNDTNTWRVVEGAGDQVDTSIHSMNDTTRKWFSRIVDSIGVSTDSLAAHIDSIVRHIPDSILDSIVKYQQYATDNFDSVIYGTGKGFSLVDSLIDSAVHYFKLSGHYDSVYRVMFSDSLGSIHSTIDDLPSRNASAIGSALGYGDTASTTLRGDLNGIREAIEGLGDTSGLGGYGGGYGDSLGRYRDSINKYYISDDRFGELVDSTEAAWGVDSLDARLDSSFAYGLCNGDDCPPCSDDSCMGSLSPNFVQRADSIARIAGDSLEASTKRQRDSLPTFWDSTFKELKQYSWFGSFDSTFLANIGAKIPNSNTCPEHCFAMDVNGTYAYVGYNMHLDWKLCRPIAPDVLNSLNAFDILKLLARILTVVTCLSILMWEVSSRRGGGIGL